MTHGHVTNHVYRVLMTDRDRLRDESSTAASAAVAWDPFEVWRTRVHLPRLARERGPSAEEEVPVDTGDQVARSPA